MDYMRERCGAWQVGDDPDGGEVEFRVFIPEGPDPEIDAIRVAGSFQGWDFDGGVPLTSAPADGGTLWTARAGPLAADFYEYKYAVTFTGGGGTRIVSDPCARYGGFTHQNAAVAVGGRPPAENVVRPLQGGRRPLQDLNVYELMIDDFTDEYRGADAPVDAVAQRLDHLRGLGFNAILFMPWTAWKSDLFDWGYEPFQYFAIEPRYVHRLGEPSEKLSRLKALVSACHDRGIHVIMDGVFNHVSMDFPYKGFYHDPERCPYTGKFGDTFPGLQDLDFGHACTRELIRDVCRYWIETFGIDGIRFDNTVNFYVAGDIRGLPEVLDDIQAFVDDRGEENFSLTLEHIRADAATITDLTRATSFWDNSLFGRCFDGLWNARIDSGLLNALNNRRWLASEGKLPTLYLSNHDHSHITWQAGARQNEGACGGWFKTQPWAIALFTSTAVPLVPNGQEFGEEHFLPENDRGTGRRVSPRPLRWKLAADPIGGALLRLYGRLGRMRLEHPALRSAHMWPHVWDEWQTRFNPDGVGVDVERGLAIYHRWEILGDGRVDNAVVVLNFSDEERWASVPFPLDGGWTDLLDDRAVEVHGNRLDVSVPSNWGRVLVKD